LEICRNFFEIFYQKRLDLYIKMLYNNELLMMMGYCAPSVGQALEKWVENRRKYVFHQGHRKGFLSLKFYGGVIVYLWSQLQW